MEAHNDTNAIREHIHAKICAEETRRKLLGKMFILSFFSAEELSFDLIPDKRNIDSQLSRSLDLSASENFPSFLFLLSLESLAIETGNEDLLVGEGCVANVALSLSSSMVKILTHRTKDFSGFRVFPSSSHKGRNHSC